MRIAIVEDLPSWQKIIKTAFQEENHTIVGVFSNTSETTYTAILKSKPDILMMDIELEIQNAGIELVKKLNQEPDFEDTSVVFLTSLEDERFFMEAYDTKAEIANYMEKMKFQNGREKRTVREIIKQVENKKPPFIRVHGTKIFIKDILWVTIDKDYEKDNTNQKRLAIVLKDKSVVFANTADLKDFTEHERVSPLYAKEKLTSISRDTLVNIENAFHFPHEKGTKDYFIDFSEFQDDATLQLKMSQKKGPMIYKKYVR
jgi:CheY-like chemotaxis protein